jgi:protein disulfide-isomerase
MANICAFAFLLASIIVPFVAEAESRLPWMTNYESAVAQAKASNKPLLLFFTGSDWCGWCKKLENEALNTEEFYNLAGDKFIFVMLDFPMNKPTDPRIQEQNKRLQQKYDIKGYPTIVILSKDEQQIGSVGYRPGGGASYAQNLLRMVSDFSQYKQKVAEADKNKLSARELKGVYLKACELGREDEMRKLTLIGLKSEEKPFFLIERLRLLGSEGQIHDAEAQALKKEILVLDPRNDKGLQYEMAVIEFDAFLDEMAKENYGPEIAIEPLVRYIEKFGTTDPDHLWKLQMTISQVFLDKNKYPQALEYAQACYESAPTTVKSEIATAVKNIKKEIK